MKKIIFTLWLCLCTNLIFSQINPVYDTKTDEIYGYISFGLVEKVDKKQSLFLVSLLDVNLNQVSETTFTDNSSSRLGQIHYNGSSIYFEILPGTVIGENFPTTSFSYRIYDLKQNKVSEKRMLATQEKGLNVIGSYPIQDVGYAVITKHNKTHVTNLVAFSEANKPLYSTYPYGNPKKKKAVETLKIGDIHKGVLATINFKWEKEKSKKPNTVLMLIDITNGNTIKEISFDNANFNMEITNVKLTDDKVFVFGDTYEKKQAVSGGRTAGMMKAVLDIHGNIITQKELVWADLQSKIDGIKEGGFVKKNGFIYTHSYVFDKTTKHTIVVGEYIKGDPFGITVKDMIFLDFDEQFNLHQVFEVEKKGAVMGFGGDLKFGSSRDYIYSLKRLNYFGYSFHNHLEQESGLSFFYHNTEKTGFSKLSYTHGMVVYKDGKFSANKFQWDTNRRENEIFKLYPSKPGYFLLSRSGKDIKRENRLERIDY